MVPAVRGRPGSRRAGLRRHVAAATCLLLLLAMSWSLVAPAGEVAGSGAAPVLVVATRHAPPFAIKGDDGGWSGISIDLWSQIANELGWRFRLREMGLGEMLEALERGEVDAGVAALTITPERETRFDFSHPFLSSGIGIAVPVSSHGGWVSVLARLSSPRFLGVVGGLLGLLLAIGLLAWLLERRRNPQFAGRALQGIGSGLWWSAVTMTTVGYGDKAPITFWGRLLGLAWMFAGIIAISSFTAAMTTALTVGDLAHQVFDDLGVALSALAAGRLDAVVYDAPILRHRAIREVPGIVQVLPQTLERQDYGIGLPASSPLREPLNRVLLQRLREPPWQSQLNTYLGANTSG